MTLRHSLTVALTLALAAIARMPVASVAAAGFTLLGIAAIHDVELFASEETRSRLMAVLALGYFAGIAGALFAEGRQRSPTLGAMIGIGLVALLALRLMVLPAAERVPDPLLLGFLAPGLLLLATAAPFLRRDADNDAFWAFNCRTAFAVGLGILSGVILGGGLAALGAALRALFEVEISWRFFSVSWLLGAGLVAPLVTLGGLPREFGASLATAPPGWLRRVALTLLAPLAIVYLVIVYGYAVTILLEWSLPRGKVAPVVGCFAAFAIIVFLVTHPWHRDRSSWLRLVGQWVFPALVLPAVLLAISVSRRIGDYGVTEQRYLLVIIVGWLALSVAGFLAGWRKLPALPATLGLALLVASFGPWGAVAMSERSQTHRLTTLLAEQDRIENGRFVSSEREVSAGAARQIGDILRYLDHSGKWPSLEPHLASLALPTDRPRHSRVGDLLATLEIPDLPLPPAGLAGEFAFENPGAIPTGEFDHVRSVELWPEGKQQLETPAGEVYELDILSEAATLTLSAADGRQVAFDLSSLAEAALASGHSGASREVALGDLLTDERIDGGLRVRLHAQSLHGESREGVTRVWAASLILLIAED